MKAGGGTWRIFKTKATNCHRNHMAENYNLLIEDLS
jgi:hypothetical protein